MKKKNKHKHRNARLPTGRVVKGLPRVSQRAPQSPDDPIDWTTVAATLGGAGVGAVGGAFVGKHTSKLGASLVMTTGGLVGAALAHGPIRAASMSVMAVGAGQLADVLMAPSTKPAPTGKRNAMNDNEIEDGEWRQAALPPPKEPELTPSLREELARAHAAVAALYPDDDYAAHRFAA